MRILLYSSPTYTDTNAVGSWLQTIVSQSGGELVTVALHGGASTDAREIIERSPDSGMTWDMWDTKYLHWNGAEHYWEPVDLLQFDEIIYLWQHPDREDRIVTVARNLGIPILELGDSLLSERQI